MRPPRAKEHAAAAAGAAGSSPDASIVWREDAGVYKPTPKNLADFLSEIELVPPQGGLVASRDLPLIFIKRNCMDAMEAHARCDILNEQAGILCGQAYLDGRGAYYLAVVSALPVDTFSSPTHFSFHQKSWEAVWNKIEADNNIVGWYHTHPGMGVFLSATDLRTHNLHFNAAWHVAIVLDPVSRQIGVFHGTAGEQVAAERVMRYSPGRS